jgi:hypothetical protein
MLSVIYNVLAWEAPHDLALFLNTIRYPGATFTHKTNTANNVPTSA